MDKKPIRISIWAKLIWGLVFVLLSLHIAIWITGYTYIYKTLIYTYPDIDDLDIFDSSVIQSSSSLKWPEGKDYNSVKLNPAIGQVLLETVSEAFLVVKNDSIRYEEYWDKHNENTVSNSFSVAKSIVGILIGIAQDEKLLDINDPVSKYLPEFSEGLNAQLTIRNLLTMSSGLNWDESYTSLFSKTTEAYYGNDLEKIMADLEVVQEPGKKFNYMSCNSLLLAKILQKVSGQSISDYASQKLWEPIGAVHPAFWSLDKRGGVEKAYCCFYSTARDFARVGKLMLDSGMWNNTRVLSKEYVQESLSPIGIPDETGKAVDYYGYQWWLLNHKNHKIFYARGILGQYILVIPEQRLIMVRLGNKRGEKLPNGHYTDLIAYVDGVLDGFCQVRDSL
ncbi:MAG: class C beta-lactamase-related serine hydrolase [Bacteroidetes bacterium]|nr:MAG: class C beta-lactamase-related serine hydrolase [Bacteroidota bacterium]